LDFPIPDPDTRQAKAKMKTDADDIDKEQLAHHINAEYGLNISDLTFMPRGEDSYTYSGYQPNGARYFIRAQPSWRARDLEQAYAVTYKLNTTHGLSHVVAPYPTCRGSFSVNHAGYTIALFPFIEGATLYSQGASDADLTQAAGLLAAVHRCGNIQSALPLHREKFDNPFKAPILRALQVAADSPSHTSDYRRQAVDLLLAERADILASLERMELTKPRLQKLAVSQALTHGDPNLDNFLKDREGNLHLTDWGEVAIGPPERDLSAFTGDRFEIFLRSYAGAEALELHREIFDFYFYRWSMQEIADYATRLLLQNLPPVEEEHAWTELQDYLPIRHEAILRSSEALQTTLDQMVK
jgi:aminoglycoside phosphotransferase (APT) family kinase protein